MGTGLLTQVSNMFALQNKVNVIYTKANSGEQLTRRDFQGWQADLFAADSSAFLSADAKKALKALRKIVDDAARGGALPSAETLKAAAKAVHDACKQYGQEVQKGSSTARNVTAAVCGALLWLTEGSSMSKFLHTGGLGLGGDLITMCVALLTVAIASSLLGKAGHKVYDKAANLVMEGRAENVQALATATLGGGGG